VAVVHRLRPRPGRRARHHARGARVARLDGCGAGGLPGRGLARQGSAFSDMHAVIMLSTRNLTLSYGALCVGCHGLEGNGMPNTVVAMRDNSTLRLADPRNLIVAMLDGIGAENFPHRQSMQAMPGFADKLSDAEAAALANYLRVTWGGQKG